MIYDGRGFTFLELGNGIEPPALVGTGIEVPKLSLVARLVESTLLEPGTGIECLPTPVPRLGTDILGTDMVGMGMEMIELLSSVSVDGDLVLRWSLPASAILSLPLPPPPPPTPATIIGHLSNTGQLL